MVMEELAPQRRCFHARTTQNQTMVISKEYEVYPMFGFTIYLMYLADYFKQKKSKKQKDYKAKDS